MQEERRTPGPNEKLEDWLQVLAIWQAAKQRTLKLLAQLAQGLQHQVETQEIQEP